MTVTPEAVTAGSGSKMRWRIAYRVGALRGQCWADLVSWALRWNVDGGKSRLPWRPVTSTCKRDLAGNGACYCGRLRSGAGSRTAGEKQ